MEAQTTARIGGTPQYNFTLHSSHFSVGREQWNRYHIASLFLDSFHLSCCCPEDFYFISRFHLTLRAIQTGKLLCLNYTMSFRALQDALLTPVGMRISGISL